MAARAKIGQAVVLALILGVVYLQQDMDQKGIQNVNGALFVLLTNISFGNVFAVVNIFCSELPVFKREHYGGMYRVDAYFIAKQVSFTIFTWTFLKLLCSAGGLATLPRGAGHPDNHPVLDGRPQPRCAQIFHSLWHHTPRYTGP